GSVDHAEESRLAPAAVNAADKFEGALRDAVEHHRIAREADEEVRDVRDAALLSVLQILEERAGGTDADVEVLRAKAFEGLHAKVLAQNATSGVGAEIGFRKAGDGDGALGQHGTKGLRVE